MSLTRKTIRTQRVGGTNGHLSSFGVGSVPQSVPRQPVANCFTHRTNPFRTAICLDRAASDQHRSDLGRSNRAWTERAEPISQPVAFRQPPLSGPVHAPCHRELRQSQACRPGPRSRGNSAPGAFSRSAPSGASFINPTKPQRIEAPGVSQSPLEFGRLKGPVLPVRAAKLHLPGNSLGLRPSSLAICAAAALGQRRRCRRNGSCRDAAPPWPCWPEGDR